MKKVIVKNVVDNHVQHVPGWRENKRMEELGFSKNRKGIYYLAKLIDNLHMIHMKQKLPGRTI